MTSLLAISRKPAFRKAAVAFLGGMAALGLAFVPPLPTFVGKAEQLISDAILRTTGGPPERKDLVLLGIDDASMSDSDLDPSEVKSDPVLGMMSKRFPWDRSVWAATIDRLADAGAKVIAIDLIVSEPSTPEADQALADAIARHRDKVVLVSVFAPAGSVGDGGDQLTLSEPLAEFFGPGPDDTRCGFVNINPDQDGIVRSVKYRTTPREMNGVPPRPDESPVRSFSGEILDALGKPVPVGKRQLRFSMRKEGGATEVYAPRSVRSIFVPKEWRQNYDEGRFFKDKVVIIGPTAPRLHDLHATPGGLISGPQLHMQALACGLEGSFYTPADSIGLLSICLTLITSIWAMIWSWWVKRPLRSAVGAIGFVGLFLFAAVLLGARFSWQLPIVVPLVAFITGWIAALSYDLITERLEKSRLNREFRRFVSRDVADFLVRNPDLYKNVASGRRRRVVVLFSDVRGFTSRSEHTEPAELVSQLNEYLTRMVSIVFQHQGTLDKFIGDAVMAHWGALEDGSESDHARQAVGAALDMITGLAELNAKWAAEGRDPFEIGIGLHLGDVLAGEIGSVDKIEFGVIGDAVNLASRIEGLTKYFGVQLLVSDAVAHKVEQQAGLRNVGRVRVKGRVESVELHAPSRGESLDQRFHAALQLFHDGDFSAAANAFKTCLELDPEDGAAKRLWKWSEEYAAAPPPDWDGTVVMDSK